MQTLTALDNSTRHTLTHCMDYHPKRRCRKRAQAVLLRNQGYTRQQLSDIFSVQRDTVSRWLKRWDTHGLTGLYDDNRPGRPPILDHQDRQRLVSLVKASPQSLQQVAIQFTQETGKQPSIYTLKRALKKVSCVEARPSLSQTTA